MQEKGQEGIYLLSTLGTIIEDKGHENDGNILIQPLDLPKYHLIQNIMTYMGIENATNQYVELLYDDDFYSQEVQTFDQFNDHVVGIIINKKALLILEQIQAENLR